MGFELPLVLLVEVLELLLILLEVGFELLKSLVCNTGSCKSGGSAEISYELQCTEK